MLMDIDANARALFLERVTRGQTQRYRITQHGDPEAQARLKSLLPNAAVNHAVHDRDIAEHLPYYDNPLQEAA